MKYKGTTLVLDNFRTVLKDFSVDVQDVVRSALLDNVSIEKYLDSCRNNPYRLDQIRLGMKEGIDEGYFQYSSGEVIRGIRGLLKKDVNLSPLKKYRSGALSDKCFLYLIYWCKDGFNVSNLNMSIIPDYLLEFFDFGVRHDIDMKPFNNGYQYSINLVDYLIRIVENGCPIDKFSKGEWSNGVLDIMLNLSKLQSKSRYMSMYKVLSGDINEELLGVLELISSMDTKVFNEIADSREGVSKYSIEEYKLLSDGYKNGISVIGMLRDGRSDEEIKGYITKKKLEKGRVLSGSLRTKDRVIKK